MPSPKRGLWAAATVTGAMNLLPLILIFLSIHPGEYWDGLWLLTPFNWYGLQDASATLFIQVLAIEGIVLGVLI